MHDEIERLQNLLDVIVWKQFGLSYMDLPVLVFLSDYCWEGMDAKDIANSAKEVLQVLRDEGELP